MTHKIGVVGGDGIGPEVTSEALRVLEIANAPIQCFFYDLGGARYLHDETILPEAVLQDWHEYDALLFGAIGTPGVPPGVIERGLLLRMRFELDLYINLRPFKTPSNQLGHPVDIVCVRENTEGPYAGEGGILRIGTPFEVATQGSVNTRHGVERCVRYAFELAKSRERKQLTLIHKTNVLGYAGDLWLRTFNELGEEFTQVETNYEHIDAACIHLVNEPQRFDVIVTDNLFGDIITDLAGAVGGGIGLAASANLNPSRTGPSMFEPVHGSAPDIAGKSKANPIAAIKSAAMMMEFLGETEVAARITKACEQVIHDGSLKPELFSDNSTNQITDLVLEKM